MISLTEMERKALLILAKDYAKLYNANMLSKELDISHVGAQKMLKRFKEQGMTDIKQVGKSIIHKLRLEDDYNQKLLSFLLADEANNHKRWKEEFKKLNKEKRIIMLFGSAIKNYQNAADIDIMIVMDKKDTKEVNKTVLEINQLLPKKIHAIKLSKDELLENIKDNNKAIVDIVKNAIILYGQDEYLEVITYVSGF